MTAPIFEPKLCPDQGLLPLVVVHALLVEANPKHGRFLFFDVDDLALAIAREVLHLLLAKVFDVDIAHRVPRLPVNHRDALVLADVRDGCEGALAGDGFVHNFVY